MDVVIRSVQDVSYYVGDFKKRWVYGTFCIYCSKVTFSEKSQEKPKTLVLKYEDVIKIQKATTTIFYSAIVFTLKSGETFWFSSFSDRESTFRLLNHFLRVCLFDKGNESRRKIIPDSQRTAMGTKLLSVANDSLSTMSNAAVMLNQQGEKIDRSASMMMNIHNDLDVADHITSGLESWVGRWSLPEEYKIVKPIIIKDGDIPEVFDFEVLFTKIETGKVCQQQEGVIQISRNGLCILDLKQKQLYCFEWPNVSKIRVISPWEMMVIRYQIGKPDIAYSFVSSLLINILHKVQWFAKNKMDYETPVMPHSDASLTMSEPPNSFLDKKLEQKRSQKISFPHFEDNDEITFGSVGASSSKNYNETNCVGQNQILKENPVVTNEEVNELSNTLKNLKSIMLAVGEETDIQNEKLGKVTESVDEANIKLVDINKRINKLM